MNWNSVDHLSFAGTDLQELSASLSYLHNGEVRRESRGTTKYRIDLVGTQGISIIASSYDGAFTIHFPASIDTATILIPLTGNAIVAVTDRKIPSIQNLGVFVDRLQNYELHIAGPRRHLCFRVPHDELVRRIEVRLNISVRGRLQFANEIDLSQGPGLDLARLAMTMHDGLTGETLHKTPVALGHLLEACLEFLIDAVGHTTPANFLAGLPFRGTSSVRSTICIPTSPGG